MADLLPVTSYTTLIAAIMSLAEDIGVELEEYLPVVVDLAEQKLTKELDIIGLTYTSPSITLPVGQTVITKPQGHKLAYYLKVTNPNTNVEKLLLFKQDDYLIEYWGSNKFSGDPKYYSDIDETSFRIVPSSNDVWDVVVKGVRRPDPLSASNQTNMFTRQASDALLAACMLEVATWQRNDALYAKYQPIYSECRDGLNNEGRRQRRDSGQSPQNPDPSANTLLGTN